VVVRVGINIFPNKKSRLLCLVLFFASFLFILFTIKTSVVRAACPSGWYCFGSTYMDLKNGCRIVNNTCQQKYYGARWYNCQNAACGNTWSEGTCITIGKRPPCNYTTTYRTVGCCARLSTYCGDGSCNGGETCSSCSGDCGACCSASAPTNLAASKISSNTWRLTWTPGSGSSQRVYIGNIKSQVEANCPSGTGPGTGCTVKNESVGSGVTSYDVSNLSSGTFYYYRVMAYTSGSCNAASATLTNLSSCDTSPSSLIIQQGDTQTLTTSVNSSSEIGRVDYTKSSGFVNLNPASDNSYVYSTQITGVSVGTGTITSSVKNPAGNTLCTSTPNVTVNPRDPWWQVQDSDIKSSGDLNSGVPPANFFGLVGAGGYPGVPSYTATTNLTNANVSALGWLADSDNLDLKIYDYQFFSNQIPKDTVITTVPSESVNGSFFESGGTPSYGFYWYKYDGSATGLDLTLSSAMNLGSRKVILLVDSADFYINAPINLTDGQGFFLVTVGKRAGGTKGNILVDPAVGGGASPNLEGLYEADNQFKTGVSAIQLRVRGSVAGYDGIDLQRDLGAANGATPAEFFEFAPDQIMLFPSKLGVRKINWKEVAP
jgi:hypothetical protein